MSLWVQDMTDEEQPLCVYRSGDIDALVAKVDGLMQFEKSHLLDYHGDLKAGEKAFWVAQTQANTAELERRLPWFELLIEDVQGKKVVDPVTGLMIDREPSIRKLISNILDQLAENRDHQTAMAAKRQTWTAAQWTFIGMVGAALISASAAVIVAVIQGVTL